MAFCRTDSECGSMGGSMFYEKAKVLLGVSSAEAAKCTSTTDWFPWVLVCVKEYTDFCSPILSRCMAQMGMLRFPFSLEDILQGILKCVAIRSHSLRLVGQWRGRQTSLAPGRLKDPFGTLTA